MSAQIENSREFLSLIQFGFQQQDEVSPGFQLLWLTYADPATRRPENPPTACPRVLGSNALTPFPCPGPISETWRARQIRAEAQDPLEIVGWLRLSEVLANRCDDGGACQHLEEPAFSGCDFRRTTVAPQYSWWRVSCGYPDDDTRHHQPIGNQSAFLDRWLQHLVYRCPGALLILAAVKVPRTLIDTQDGHAALQALSTFAVQSSMRVYGAWRVPLENGCWEVVPGMTSL